MKSADKDLLLKDLCARLPYGVKVDVINEDNEHRIVKIGEGNIGHLGKGFWKECKPYLFPLSSMTAEQKTSHNFLKYSAHANPVKLVDFYNKHHLDYRGLIPMGLAIDATNLNIY